MQQFTSRSGEAIFPVGIGTWEISSTINPDKASELYKGVEPVRGNEEREVAAIKHSLELGQNHIDCAELYGGFYTDEVVGKAIKDMPREDLFIADKLWKLSVSEGKVEQTVATMLKKLGTEYLDILYIHAPWDGIDWRDAIPQIDDLIDAGIVRYFGVSNFSLELLKETTAESRHGVSFVQQNFNVAHQSEANTKYREWCASNDIQVVAYCPFDRQRKGAQLIQDMPIVKELADKYQVTSHQIALAWLIAVGSLPIPKSTNFAHIEQNIDATKVQLSDEDIAAITAD